MVKSIISATLFCMVTIAMDQQGDQDLLSKIHGPIHHGSGSQFCYYNVSLKDGSEMQTCREIASEKISASVVRVGYTSKKLPESYYYALRDLHQKQQA